MKRFIMDVINYAKSKMALAIEHFKQELNNIRTGKANPAILDGVIVEAYGSMMKLREVANVTTPEARQLLVSPFDKALVQAISKGIERANLNLNPITDATTIRIVIPPMDESTRKDMVKLSKKKGEEAKVVIRQIRKDCNDKLKQLKAEGTHTEDSVKKDEKSVQDLTDKFCVEVDKLLVIKEKDILSI